MKITVILSVWILFLIAGCQQAAEVAPTQAPTEMEIPATQVPTEMKDSLTIETGTIAFDSDGEVQNRTYFVFLPDAYTGAEKYPLVIYLHSYGWNAEKGMNYTRLNQAGNSYNFIIAYPNANENWNSGVGDSSSNPTPDNDDVRFISEFIDILSEQFSIDQERIYATGYSNGGFMAYKLACQLSDRIAAIASVSGVMSASVKANCNPSRTVPVLDIHGTKDPWVPITGKDTAWLSADQSLSYWTNFNGCKNTDTAVLPDSDPADDSTVEITSFSNCTDDSNVIYYQVINGGHSWPGAGPAGYYVGNTNQDFNANEVIWNFFKNYRLNLEN